MKIRKTNLITVFFVFGILIFSSIQSTQASADYGITSVQHSPNPLVKDHNMTVTVEFYNSSEVNLLRLLVCELAPEFICDPSPILMQRDGDTFTVEYVFTQEENATIGFHIQIIFLNDSILMIPDSSDFLNMENIDEPSTGDYYFSAGEIKGETEVTNGFTIGIISSAIFIAVLVMKRKRN